MLEFILFVVLALITALLIVFIDEKQYQFYNDLSAEKE